MIIEGVQRSQPVECGGTRREDDGFAAWACEEADKHDGNTSLVMKETGVRRRDETERGIELDDDTNDDATQCARW
jgi:hypothetical protein